MVLLLLVCMGIAAHSYCDRLLESCNEDQKSLASRWWFHLHGLCLEVSGNLGCKGFSLI